MAGRVYSSITLTALLLYFICSQPVLADDTEIPNSGTVDSYGRFGFDYQLDGVHLTSSEWYAYPGHLTVDGEITDPVVKISGNLNIMCSAYKLNEYEAKIVTSTSQVDPNGESFFSNDFVSDGPTWDWSGTLDGREVKKGFKEQVPFSLEVPVPAYNPASDVKYLYFKIQLDITQTVYAYETPERKHNYVTLYGDLKIPESMKAEPKVKLTITNGGELNPLKIKLKLTDSTSGSPMPIEHALIEVEVPIPGSEKLGLHIDPLDVSTVEPTSAADALYGPEDKEEFWALASYFRCINNTICINCGEGMPISQFSSEKYFKPKKPSKPIEVLTNDQGVAELEFFLDFNALGSRIPKRTKPLQIPVRAEYIVPGNTPGDSTLIRGSLLIEMKYIGYVTSITCIEPQYFGNGQLLAPSKAEIPLANYKVRFELPKPTQIDEGTKGSSIKVYGSDRVMFTPYIVALSEDDQTEIQRDPLQARPLQRHMLFSYGDQISIDASGLIRTSEPNGAGFRGDPGWIWVQVHFFDSLNGRIGVSGLVDRHTVTFGKTPEKTGWKPTEVKDFVYWGAKKGSVYLISQLHPVLGTVRVVHGVGSFLNWSVTNKEVYIRVESELLIDAQENGSATIIVREGQPAVFTKEAPPDGILVEPGSTLILGSDDQFEVRPSTAEEISRADELLSKVRNPDLSGGEPIEVDVLPPPAAPPVETIEPPTEIPPAVQAPEVESPLELPTIPPDTRTMMSVIIDDLVFDLRGDWESWPESDDSFPILANEDIGLYVAILNLPASTDELVYELEMETGPATMLTVAGRQAQWIPLLEDGVESGALLSFTDPMPNGYSLYVNFFSGPDYWVLLRNEVAEILAGMHFL